VVRRPPDRAEPSLYAVCSDNNWWSQLWGLKGYWLRRLSSTHFPVFFGRCFCRPCPTSSFPNRWDKWEEQWWKLLIERHSLLLGVCYLTSRAPLCTLPLRVLAIGHSVAMGPGAKWFLLSAEIVVAVALRWTLIACSWYEADAALRASYQAGRSEYQRWSYSPFPSLLSFSLELQRQRQHYLTPLSSFHNHKQ
jgi:hypothetical protein